MKLQASTFLLIALCLFARSSKAQITPLEDTDEDLSSGRVRARAPAAPLPTVSAVALPESAADKEALSKKYDQVMEAVKSNHVDEAQTIMGKFDVITQQKILNRMIEEAPARGTAAEEESPAPAAPTPSEEIKTTEEPKAAEEIKTEEIKAAEPKSAEPKTEPSSEDSKP